MNAVPWLRRTLWIVVGTLGVLVVAAAPASAHTVSGQGATNFRTSLTSVSPPLAGLSVRSVELGSQLELTWTGADDVIVLGYQGEPYLRVGPGGVARNRLSPSTYLNQTRLGGSPIPPNADPKAPPEWVTISDGRTVRWHDHRTHWMGGTLPRPVRLTPGTFHNVFHWDVMVSHNGQPITVTGTLDWVPGSSPWPWWGLVAIMAVVGAAGGATRRWATALLVWTALIVGVDVVHALGSGLAFVGSVPHRVLLVIAGSYYSVIAWGLGVVAVRLLARRSVDGLFAALFAALVIGLFGGLADVTALTRSQVPFAFGDVADRALVAISIGGALGVTIGSVVAFRRNRPEPGDAGAENVTGAAPAV